MSDIEIVVQREYNDLRRGQRAVVTRTERVDKLIARGWLAEVPRPVSSAALDDAPEVLGGDARESASAVGEQAGPAEDGRAGDKRSRGSRSRRARAGADVPASDPDGSEADGPSVAVTS